MAEAGVCQYCGVRDELVDGDGLRWHDVARTCCSQHGCVKQYERAERLLRTFRPRSRYSGWGYGAIVEDLRRQRRGGRRRKRRR